jgi:hypothetical protein
MVAFANEKIDENGRIKDEKTKEMIRRLVESLVVWTRKITGA